MDAETVAKISQTQSRIDFYDVTEKKIRDSIQFPDEFDNCGFSEDGKWLLVSSETDNWWHLHNRESKKRVASFIAIRSWIRRFVVSPDGQIMLTQSGSRPGITQAWSTRDGRQLWAVASQQMIGTRDDFKEVVLIEDSRLITTRNTQQISRWALTHGSSHAHRR